MSIKVFRNSQLFSKVLIVRYSQVKMKYSVRRQGSLPLQLYWDTFLQSWQKHTNNRFIMGYKSLELYIWIWLSCYWFVFARRRSRNWVRWNVKWSAFYPQIKGKSYFFFLLWGEYHLCPPLDSQLIGADLF